MIFTAKEIAGLGTILGIWAHPDDESWTMAGVMAQASKNGQRVTCITATRGDNGKTSNEARWPQAKLGEIRTGELEAALKVLGASEHYWLNCQDGKLKDHEAKLFVQEIVEIINKVQPDSIFTFGPDGLTGHDDHRTIYAWAKQAAKIANSQAKIYFVAEEKEKYSRIPQEFRKLIYFNTVEPTLVDAKSADIFYELPEGILKIKIAALKAQPCQMDVFFVHPLGEAFLKKYAASECFMVSDG